MSRNYWFTDRYGVQSADSPELSAFGPLLDAVADVGPDEDFATVSIEDEHGWAVTFGAGWADFENVTEDAEQFATVAVERDDALGVAEDFVRGDIDDLRSRWPLADADDTEPAAAEASDDIGVFLAALGEGIYSEAGFAVQRLAGPTFTQDTMPEGDLFITFPEGGVSVNYEGDEPQAVAVFVFIQPTERVDAYPAPDQLISGLRLSTAGRADVAEHFGEPARSGGAFDVFAVDDRFLHFEYSSEGQLKMVTAVLSGPGF